MSDTSSRTPKTGAWLSDGSTAVGEIVASLGFDFVVLDVEHGAFDLTTLERFIPLLKGLGLEVFSKVLVPERGAVQQALDFGSDGVIIPHIESAEHAEFVTSYGKFPPLGSRSLAGGRTMGYGGYDDDWVEQQNRDVKVFPMVEDPGALRDVEKIAALPTVDGIFIGPGDLSQTGGRGAYTRTEEDFDDFRAVVSAVRANRKQWVFPAWSTVEKEFAVSEDADYALLTMQHVAVVRGYEEGLKEMEAVRAGTCSG
ncbi:HpcH/HpaI aldolase family protein [Microbacterium halotolerans]|uniref:HpcH/HpaI aldolase family protein n=1 Tax=Microbacterium halotolerans TaxID=246613 RepID=UPI000E6AB7B4|nr:aldolase/citrate lyase family protein [Microbacterium halotolerans]